MNRVLIIILLILAYSPIFSQGLFDNRQEGNLGFGLSNMAWQPSNCYNQAQLWVNSGRLEFAFSFGYGGGMFGNKASFDCTNAEGIVDRTMTTNYYWHPAIGLLVGYNIIRWISIGVVGEAEYYHMKKETIEYRNGSDADVNEELLGEKKPFGLGMYAKLIYPINQNFDVFAVGKYCNNGNHGAMLGINYWLK